MDITNFIKDSLEKYDNNNNKYKNKISKNYQIDSNKKIIYFKDDDDNILFKSRYETLGIYHNSINLWIWSWAFATIISTSDKSSLSKKLFDYGFYTNLNNFIKIILVTSRLKIKSKLEFDIFLALISNIGKVNIFKHKINNGIFCLNLIDLEY